MNRFKIAQYIASVATAFTVLGFCIMQFAGMSIGESIMIIGFIIGLVSYIFGGFLTAIKMAAGIAKWGWIAVPFPYDIITFIFTFFLAIYVLVFLPIVPVRKAYKKHMEI